MMSFLICLLAGCQTTAQHKVDLWHEISRMERLIQNEVNAIDTQGMVLPNDPVRGYYFQGQGIMFFIPIRYRTQAVRPVDLEFPNSSAMMKAKERKRKDKEGVPWSQQISDWQNQVERREAIKDAAFGEVLQALSKSLPKLIADLPRLNEGESLMLVIEEREPAWVYGSFGPSNQFKRKITTLRIEGRHLAALQQAPQKSPTLGQYVSRKTHERPASLFVGSRPKNTSPDSAL